MTLLITKEEIISTCIAGRTFDIALIKDSMVDAAQEDFMRPAIGDDLYAEIVAQAAASGLTTLNQALIDQFKPALAWYTLTKAGPLVMMNITAAGLQINNSEFASSGTDKQRADIYQTLEGFGRSMQNKFTRWINADYVPQSGGTRNRTEDYPLYKNGNTTCTTADVLGGIIL